MSTGPVLDFIIIPKQPSQVGMLLRGLDYLREQFLQTSVVSDDDEVMSEEILTPFLNGCRDSKQFTDIC